MSTYVLPPGSKKYRGPSPDLWKQYDADVAKNPYYGFEYSNDFATLSSTTTAVSNVNPEWLLTRLGSSSATFGPTPNTLYGTVTLSTAASTDTHGGSAQLIGGGFLPGAGRGLYYETLVRFSGLGTVSSTFAQGFIGMADAGGTVLSGAALNVNGIGYTLAANGEITFTLKGSGSVQTKSTGIVAAASTWYHLGFAVDRRLGVCNAWVNSVKDNLSTAVTTKHFTKAEVDTIVTDCITPTYVIVAKTGGTGTIEIDWVRAAMLGEPEVR